VLYQYNSILVSYKYLYLLYIYRLTNILLYTHLSYFTTSLSVALGIGISVLQNKNGSP